MFFAISPYLTSALSCALEEDTPHTSDPSYPSQKKNTYSFAKDLNPFLKLTALGLLTAGISPAQLSQPKLPAKEDKKSPQASHTLSEEGIKNYLLSQRGLTPRLIFAYWGLEVPWSPDLLASAAETKNFHQIHRQALDSLAPIIKPFQSYQNIPQYQKHLALGLFYAFRHSKKALSPEAKALFRQLGMEPWTKAQEKKLKGLSLKTSLKETSGLRETLTKQAGDCTERSEILYAALNQAGLKPSFVFQDPLQEEAQVFKDFANNLPGFSHVSIALFRACPKKKDFGMELGWDGGQEIGIFLK